MGLDKESKNRAYLLGRALAIISRSEKLSAFQMKTAVEFPAQMFPELIRKYSVAGDAERMEEFAEVMDALPADVPFPDNQPLEDQSRVWTGYYHELAAISKEDNRRKVAKAIKLKRTEMELTQEQLAEKAGITKQTVCNIESGDCNVSMDILSSVMGVLEIELSMAN